MRRHTLYAAVFLALAACCPKDPQSPPGDVECNVDVDCAGLAHACQDAVCASGNCALAPTADGSACALDDGGAGACDEGVCR